MSRGVKRVCAICSCNTNSGEIYAFDELLRDLEIEGRYAHPTCVMAAQRKAINYVRKHGVVSANRERPFG